MKYQNFLFGVVIFLITLILFQQHFDIIFFIFLSLSPIFIVGNFFREMKENIKKQNLETPRPKSKIRVKNKV